MSSRVSPDGLYYWDGRAWVSTLSPDGHHRWNGARWVPARDPAHSAPQGVAREPTSWTRPLQLAVAAWYAWSILWALATPLWLGGWMTQAMNQAFQSQQALSPEVSPPPAQFVDTMAGFMTAGLWVTSILYSAVFAVVMVGALRGWVWIFYAVLVLLGLTVVTLPLDLVYTAFGMPHMAGVPSFSPPGWLYPAAFVAGLPGAALFVWMLVAQVRRGPWAMRTVG